MPPGVELAEPVIETRKVSPCAGGALRTSASVRATLRGIERAFGQPFAVLDAASGELKRPPAEWLDFNPYACLVQCEEVARRGQPKIIDEYAPLVVLGIPLSCDSDSSHLLAISTFLTEPVECADQIAAAAYACGIDADRAFRWSRRRKTWPTHALLQLSSFFMAEWEQTKQIATLRREKAELLNSIVRALSFAIDAKDSFTCGHSERAARLAVQIARHMGCSDDELETVYLAGLLHDIGKIGIDDTVLRKPGPLSEAEFEHIKLHPELGCRILAEVKQLEQVLPIVLHHHEAWNGEGYPDGLKGEETPLLARIVAVADSVDAMSSDRPYRAGLPQEYLNEVLRHGSGCQWDPAVIEAYFEICEESHLSYDSISSRHGKESLCFSAT